MIFIRNNFSLDLYQFVAKESNSLKTWRILIPIKLILFRIRQQKCHRVRKSGCFRCFGFNLHNSQLSWLSSMFFSLKLFKMKKFHPKFLSVKGVLNKKFSSPHTFSTFLWIETNNSCNLMKQSIQNAERSFHSNENS